MLYGMAIRRPLVNQVQGAARGSAPLYLQKIDY